MIVFLLNTNLYLTGAGDLTHLVIAASRLWSSDIDRSRRHHLRSRLHWRVLLRLVRLGLCGLAECLEGRHNLPPEAADPLDGVAADCPAQCGVLGAARRVAVGPGQGEVQRPGHQAGRHDGAALTLPQHQRTVGGDLPLV